jgi:hypothetical protein
MTDNKNNNEYFAAKDPKETASILLARTESFYKNTRYNQYLDKIHKAWAFYHGNFNEATSHEVSFTGEAGELVQLPVNHYRNIAQHIFNMITANRPVMESRAINTDYKSLAQTYLANGVCEYYMREKNLENCIKNAVEYAVVMGSGFIKLAWNATAGEQYDYDEETQQFNYEGDLEFSNLSPLDVVVDGTKDSWDNDWMVVRSFKNRYDLMAKYPERADEIRALPSKSDITIQRIGMWSNDETDDIPMYEFYHRRTEALPDGRYMLFLDDSIDLLDAKLPYRVIPIFRIAPGNILGTPYGYTPMFDLYPLQEAANSMYSAIMTNNNAFAVQSLFVKNGSDISVNSLGEGMQIITGNEAPVPLQLTSTPAEAFKFLEMIVQSMETISGVNSVTRGNPEASLKSGTALALVQSMSLQFMSNLQQSYVKLVEDVGTSLIQILKDFAQTPRIIALVGKNKRPLLKEFTGEKISSINRVIVDVGNPLSRTIAGRVQMAEQMLQMKLLKSPEQYFQVIETGRLDSTYEGEMMELLLIKSENEQLLDGETPITSPLDSHSLHIKEHKSVLADPDLRRDPTLVKAALDHVEDHLNMLRTTDPALLNLVGEQQLPPLQQAVGDPNSQGGFDPSQGNQGPPPPPGQPGPQQPQGGPAPQGPAQPAPGGQPPQAALRRSPMNHVLAETPTGPGSRKITGGLTTNPAGETLPNIPHPPAPFKNLPTNPAQAPKK